jgi:alpha-beta hydrolase superfamily lysophospholipase
MTAATGSRGANAPAPTPGAVRSAFRLATAALLTGLALAGCAATFQPMGPGVETPRLTPSAVVASDGFELPLRSWLPADGHVLAVVVGLHGFNDYSNSFEGAGQFLAAHKMATYAYDQRGFGASGGRGIWPGEPTLVADLAAVVGLVRARHPGVPLYVLGESMGGAVALAALTGPEPMPAVDGAILVAPAVWGKEVMGFLPRAALWLSYNTVPGMVVHPPQELNIRPSDNIEMLRALGRDPLVIKGSRVDAIFGLTDLMGRALTACQRLATPSLVLFGANEQVLPPLPVKRAIATLEPQGRHVVAVYPEGWHMLLRDLKGDVVLNDIVAWIGDHAHPLPSGADRGPRPLVAERG